MSHIHIALVGNETYPVFSVIQFLKPDKIYLVCSEGTNGSLNQAKTVASNLGEEQSDIKIVTMEPSDFDSIYSSIEELKSNILEDDYLTCNLTGGTKFWALAFYKIFAGRPDTQLYLFNQNNSLWNLGTNTSTSLVGLDLDTIIALYGNKTTTFRKFSEYTDEDEKSLEKLENFRKYNYITFNALAAVPEKKNADDLRTQNSGIFTDKNGNSIIWSKPDKVVLSFKNKTGKVYTTKLESPNAVSLTFNSGWFEYKVAKILSGWDKVKEIRLNCIFPLKPGFPKNEVDIIVNTDIKPIFVECKTSIHSATDVDKFSTVVNNYGGAACKALFITDQPMKDLPDTKCKESDIAAFSLQNHTREDLYNFLDSILVESNK